MGNLYVATEGGNIFRQQDIEGSFEHLALSPFEPHTIYWIHAVGAGELWLGTDKGVRLINFDVANDFNQASNRIVGDSDRASMVMAKGKNGKLYIGQGARLLVASEDSLELNYINLLDNQSSQDSSITALCPINNRTIAVGTDAGLLEVYDVGAIDAKKVFSKELATGVLVTDLLHGEHGILASTDNGLYFIKNFGADPVRIDRRGEGLSHPDIFDLFAYGMNVLIGTIAGTNVFSYSTFEHFNSAYGAERFSVNAFGEDLSGTVWIGAQSGLYSLPNAIPEVAGQLQDAERIRKYSPISERVTAIQGINDEIAVGFQSSGMSFLSPSNDSFSQSKSTTILEKFGIVDLLLTSDESIWIATHRNGLYRYLDGVTQGPISKAVIHEGFIHWVIGLDNQDILVGTAESIYRKKADTQEFERLIPLANSGAKAVNVISAAATKDGGIWFGTQDNGLFFWSYDSIAQGSILLDRRGASSQFRNDTIYGIQIDSEGSLWMPTQRGLIKTDSKGNFQWRFGPGDGLQGEDFRWGAAYRASDGAMYLGGSNGFNRFYPERVTIDRTPPRTILSKIHFPDSSYLNFRKYLESTGIQISHKDRFVTFEIGIINSRDSLNSRFRFQLEGFDPKWVYTGSRNTATYTNLPHGDYVFLAQGANTAGIWDPKGLRIPVTVLPPPWLSWWAYCFYTLIALLAGWAAHRTYQSYVIQRHAVKLAQQMAAVEEAAEEEMEEQLEFQEAILQSAYSHKKDTLRLIGAVVDDLASESPDTPSADDHSDLDRKLHALELLEECMFYSVDGALANLHRFVELAIAELMDVSPVDPGTIVTTNDVPKSLIPASAASPIAIMLFELIKNSLQHAFQGGSPANYIYIKLEVAAGESWDRRLYTLSVSDTGVGAPADLLKNPVMDSGAARIASVIKNCGATADLDVTNGTSVTITFSTVIEASPS